MPGKRYDRRIAIRRMIDAVKPHRPTRHRWLPLTVLLITIAWWFETAADLWYATLSQLIVIVFAGASISVWYLWFGGSKLSFRAFAFGFIWGAVLLLLAVFKPIYNGDVGIVGWRMRYAATHDGSLIQEQQNDVATDLQTTPRDYPKFLGNGYWPEVPEVELNHDWQTHAPHLVWQPARLARLVCVRRGRQLCVYARTERRSRARCVLSLDRWDDCLDARGPSSLRPQRFPEQCWRQGPPSNTNGFQRQGIYSRCDRYCQLS